MLVLGISSSRALIAAHPRLHLKSGDPGSIIAHTAANTRIFELALSIGESVSRLLSVLSWRDPPPLGFDENAVVLGPEEATDLLDGISEIDTSRAR